MKNLSAEFLLHALIGALVAAVVLAGGAGYYGQLQARGLATAAAQTARDLGAATGLARGADAAAAAQATEITTLLGRGADTGAPEQKAAIVRAEGAVVQRHVEEARQLLETHRLDTSALVLAAQAQGRIQQQALQRIAAGAGDAAGIEKWTEVGGIVDRLVRDEITRMEQASTRHARDVGLGFVLLAVLALIGAWFMRNAIRDANASPLKTATQLVQRVADGDLTATVEGMDQLHTRRLSEALNQMITNLRAMVGETARGAHSVADTSAQIAQGNLDLSQRTEEQASTLQDTASSMEELTSTVARNAQNARQASQLASGASETAQRGGEVVDEVVNTMDEILDASRKITDIIGVIDSIAFQTNILALNAAVEAARAGDQGRGFAVVAAEVRNLAHRSAAAAKEIKALIGDSVQKVQAGSAKVDEAGHTMVGVVMSVQKVSELIAEIAAASQEQSSRIGQVSSAVVQMDRVVQQNASLVEEAAAATESMKDQATALLGVVSRFRLGSQPSSAGAAGPGRIEVRPSVPAPYLTAVMKGARAREQARV